MVWAAVVGNEACQSPWHRGREWSAQKKDLQAALQRCSTCAVMGSPGPSVLAVIVWRHSVGVDPLMVFWRLGDGHIWGHKLGIWQDHASLRVRGQARLQGKLILLTKSLKYAWTSMLQEPCIAGICRGSNHGLCCSKHATQAKQSSTTVPGGVSQGVCHSNDLQNHIYTKSSAYLIAGGEAQLCCNL